MILVASLPYKLVAPRTPHRFERSIISLLPTTIHNDEISIQTAGRNRKVEESYGTLSFAASQPRGMDSAFGRGPSSAKIEAVQRR